MAANMFHLGWFLGNGFGVQAWNQQWAGNGAQDWMKPDQYIDLARAIERAGFEFLMMEDSVQIPDAYQGSTEYYLKSGTPAPKNDPATLAPILLHQTDKVGIVTTLTTTFYHPYTVARMMASLDHIGGGRAGWNIVTGSSTRAAQNFGFDMPEHDLRYDMADEFVDLAMKLWESWEPGAVMADPDRGYADHTKVHPLDFEGKFYKSRGPLNTVPSPQGHPVLLQAGGSEKGKDLAAKYVDSIIANPPGVEKMKAYREDIRRRAVAFGRSPDDIKVMYLVSPILGETDAEAQGKLARREAAKTANIEALLAGRSHLASVDLSQFDLDEPLPANMVSNGHQSSFANFKGDGTQTLRERVLQHSATDSVPLVGSPATVAAQMDEVMQEVGGDGFLIVGTPLHRRYISEITDGLVPALRKRGLTRSHYEHATMRENLLAF